MRSFPEKPQRSEQRHAGTMRTSDGVSEGEATIHLGGDRRLFCAVFNALA